MKDSKVTPWEVRGEVDYERLIREFGTEKINEELLGRIKEHTKKLHFMLTRKIFFCHRDLNWILDEYEKGNKFYLYTGRAPSGPVHLGHVMVWNFTKWLQDKFGTELWFQFPDEEKFLFKQELSLEDTEKYLQDNMLDVVALGFDKKKTRFIIDTKHANIMYKEACRVAKKITFSMAKASFGLTEQTNIGAIFYTSMQAVPSFLPSVLKNKRIPCLIPHAADQDAHFRITRDILPKLGYYKPASIQCIFLPPLTRTAGKMSASEENAAVYTTDTPEEAAKKIRKHAFSGGQATIEEHKRKGGNPDIDVSYQWLRMMFEDNDKKLQDIHDNYKSGKLLTGELKEILIEKVTKFLREHQKKREKARKQVNKFILKQP